MLRLLACLFLLLVAVPPAAAAEWHFTPFVGLTFKGKTSGMPDWENATGEAHKNFGGVVTAITGGTIGVEAIFVDAPEFFKHGDVGLVSEGRSLALMGNVVVTAPRRWTEYTLRPFVSAGLGLMRVNNVDVAETAPVRVGLSGFNVGGGAFGFFSKRTGVRFDFRYYSTLRPVEDVLVSINGPRIRYMTASVGLVFRH